MRLFAFLVSTALAVLPFVSANYFIDGVMGSLEVRNLCSNTVILHSVGDGDGPAVHLPPGSLWSERYYMKDLGGGPSIKIWEKGGSMQNILQFEYNPEKPLWYDLSYVNCWDAKARSGDKCPFWNQSMVVESPGQDLPCTSGRECPYIYRCPHDDDNKISIINGPPMHILDDPTQNLKLHLCPCENDPSSRECALARADGLPTTQRSHRIQAVDFCPEQPFSFNDEEPKWELKKGNRLLRHPHRLPPPTRSLPGGHPSPVSGTIHSGSAAPTWTRSSESKASGLKSGGPRMPPGEFPSRLPGSMPSRSAVPTWTRSSGSKPSAFKSGP